LTLEQIQAQNEAQLRLEKLENISRNVAANGAFEIIDVSRLSTERVAPFFQHRMTDTTFIKSVEVGRENILIASFRLM
jgi:hypothetical protein